MNELIVIAVASNGHTWLFTFDHSPRSFSAFFDVLIAYERDPESGFEQCHSNHVLRELAHQLHANASRRIAGISNATATKF